MFFSILQPWQTSTKPDSKGIVQFGLPPKHELSAIPDAWLGADRPAAAVLLDDPESPLGVICYGLWVFFRPQTPLGRLHTGAEQCKGGPLSAKVDAHLSIWVLPFWWCFSTHHLWWTVNHFIFHLFLRIFCHQKVFNALSTWRNTRNLRVTRATLMKSLLPRAGGDVECAATAWL